MMLTLRSNRKGKLIFFYEFNITVKWTGSRNPSQAAQCSPGAGRTPDDVVVNGTVTIPNLSEENSMSEIDVCARTCTMSVPHPEQIQVVMTSDSTAERDRVLALMRRQGAAAIRTRLGAWLTVRVCAAPFDSIARCRRCARSTRRGWCCQASSSPPWSARPSSSTNPLPHSRCPRPGMLDGRKCIHFKGLVARRQRLRRRTARDLSRLSPWSYPRLSSARLPTYSTLSCSKTFADQLQRWC